MCLHSLERDITKAGMDRHLAMGECVVENVVRDVVDVDKWCWVVGCVVVCVKSEVLWRVVLASVSLRRVR